MPLDHVLFYVAASKFDETLKFYEEALAPIGYKAIAKFPGTVGFGADKPDLWISSSDKAPEDRRLTGGNHVAFSASGI
jgi:hypothetical protein